MRVCMPRAASHFNNGGTTTTRFERRGREMTPMVWKDCPGRMCVAILLQGFSECVEKILLVTFGAQYTAGVDSEALEANGFDMFAHRQNGLIVKLPALHHAAARNLLATQFGLRFYDDEHIWP